MCNGRAYGQRIVSLNLPVVLNGTVLNGTGSLVFNLQRHDTVGSYPKLTTGSPA